MILLCVIYRDKLTMEGKNYFQSDIRQFSGPGTKAGI